MAVRILVFDNTEAFIGEVSDIRSLTRVEEINGEHSLTFSTPMELSKQQRILYRDSQDAWHEYVITGVEQSHDEDVQAVGTYYCVWSLQHDLEGTIVKTQPGKVNPVTSTVALTHALAGTARWTVGSVTQNTTGGASMYYLSGWEALGQVVEVWGGEVSVTITVDDGGTILSRQVNLLSHLGSAESVRRFDYSADMQSIVRTVEDAPFTCRITPRGAAVESENGGYGRKIDITSVNGGVEYLEDPDVVDIVKLPDGNGGWEYPNQVVEFDGIEDPQTLYDTALAHLHDFTRPRVSYEASVVQLAAAGMNPHGIALGDAVDVVDKAFVPAGLRLTGRVTRAEWDDLDPANNAITIGFNPQGFAGQFQDLQADIRAINDWRDTLTTEEYISDIISRLNQTVNATGGYTYLVEGVGLVTYDVAVSDPAVGSEASAVVEIRGGTIRIANSRDGQGDWEWKTVFTSGHIAGELVTAAEIVTGYIGSAGGTYIDLDNNIVQLGDTADNSITVSDAGISFNGIGGSTVGFIDSGNTMAVGYKRVESLTSEQVEDVKDGGTATIYMAGWEEPDFADGDLTMTVRYYLGSWVPYTNAFTFSSYGTQQGTVFNAELVAASGSDPWKIVLSLRTSVQLSSASVIINWWADGAAPRVAFGGDTTGDFGFAVNYLTQANGYASFAAGNRTQVTGGSSAAFGGGTRATGNYQLVMGKWNTADSSKLFIIGNGTADNARSNALTVDEDGNVAAESFNLWRGQRTLSSADNIDQLFESGIYYLPGSVPSGTYPSGATGQYTSLLSIGNDNETSGGWVGKQILVGGVAGVWYRSYAGSPRAWSDWTSLDESRHPTEIPASSLTLTGCSLNGASTIPAYKIGRHVTINMRVNVTAANPTIAGFPATSGANSHIPVIAYRQSDNAAIAGYLTNAGVVTFPALASGSNIMLHVDYIASS